ncbi:3-oxoacyl-[acyl-carrier-protein] synthase III [Orenia metallireducens]|uniref:Beta-ketoacyl-[acyl-carrier-protein] synthase III n=2 Tax=Orenia metallireducens TaxID=1413210 RepID=A0A285HFN8_9FIRM|nr:3-oxoacyl-[acyl-carrier-protein] synthase III [Orenia metallireducens]SNY34535.1 3-oxoacyl-[acyl-carrier-protein] synthase III [Orenia metallireducens]
MIMIRELRKAKIAGVGSFAPEKVLTNNQLEAMVDTSDEWITTRTGIKERRIAEDDIATSDLAYEAAKNALADAGLEAEDLDLILVATATPDYLAFPSTACVLQDKLGVKGIPAFDMVAACSGFVYGLSVATQYIETGTYDNVLVIGAETLSKIVNWEDRGTCVLFGDGAGAAVLTPTKSGGILSNVIGADGEQNEVLIVRGGGSKRPFSQQIIDEGLHYLEMEGNPVFKFAVRILGKAAVQALKKAGLTRDDIDFLIPHQANIRIIDAAAKRLKLDRDQIYVNLDQYGNTSAASIPLALDAAVKEGKIKSGDIVVLVGFGAGLTWGATVIEWV